MTLSIPSHPFLFAAFPRSRSLFTWNHQLDGGSIGFATGHRER